MSATALRSPAAVSPESFKGSGVVPSKRMLSSRTLGWTSLLLDLHTGIESADAYSSIPTPDQKIGVAMSGRYVSEVYRDGRWRRSLYHPGAICVHRTSEAARYRFPAGDRADATFSTALIYLPHARLAAASDHLRRIGQRVTLALNATVDRDSAITQMVSALLSAMKNRADDLYADTAAAWMSVHLVTRYGALAGVEDSRSAGVIADARLSRVIEFMSAHFNQPLTLDQLAGEACVSRYHFSRLFRNRTGKPPLAFLVDIRMEAARRMLATSDLTVGEVGLACGYRTSSHFSAAFVARHGVTPTAFRARRD
jgi:AraC family transcriptional regulator